MLWAGVCWILLAPLNLLVNAFWDGCHQLDVQQIYRRFCWMKSPGVCCDSITYMFAKPTQKACFPHYWKGQMGYGMHSKQIGRKYTS